MSQGSISIPQCRILWMTVFTEMTRFEFILGTQGIYQNRELRKQLLGKIQIGLGEC